MWNQDQFEVHEIYYGEVKNSKSSKYYLIASIKIINTTIENENHYGKWLLYTKWGKLDTAGQFKFKGSFKNPRGFVKMLEKESKSYGFLKLDPLSQDTQLIKNRSAHYMEEISPEEIIKTKNFTEKTHPTIRKRKSRFILSLKE